ncbi:transglycosylase-associated protein [Chthoniobacter flavus Ellin428]|uniref:Transglycosylase-associated protein n=1 Tax=Chthoniobacter flavus Ellin428 TaxID=497964 RepID=B4D3J6_9BACT|nr:GlsB/YeaQ/YmgE family stress response membrane protein [Chthoniobacter flavus]EDY18826.1 transglycosylase-associated protein [Chthoniobacter flavus Ellin428]TCO93424.1 putative membrane protein YeaQ/YmgE (transglycosylase-associated protein family) [Chthoniobacter flavus]
MLHIIWSIIVGFIIGFVAKHLYHPAEHLGFWMTSLLGIAGSIIGGLIARLFSKPKPGAPFHPAGFILSIIGAILLLFIYAKLQ